MCLYVKEKSKKSVAQKDIIVYKVLEINMPVVSKKDDKPNLLTYYKHAVVSIGSTYKSPLRKTELNKTVVNFGLHSYANLADVLEYLEYDDIRETTLDKDITLNDGFIINNNHKVYEYGSDYVVVAECVIPKGSSYYVGTFLKRKSYASDRLTYTKIL